MTSQNKSQSDFPDLWTREKERQEKVQQPQQLLATKWWHKSPDFFFGCTNQVRKLSLLKLWWIKGISKTKLKLP